MGVRSYVEGVEDTTGRVVHRWFSSFCNGMNARGALSRHTHVEPGLSWCLYLGISIARVKSERGWVWVRSQGGTVGHGACALPIDCQNLSSPLAPLRLPFYNRL